MSSFCKATVLGRLGAPPECRDVMGSRVANFSIACNRMWSDKGGGKQEKTDWYRISVWGKQADLCATYLGKGSKVLVDGRLEPRIYQDKQGTERTMLEIKASSVVFLDGKENAANDNQGESRYDVVPDSETPF